MVFFNIYFEWGSTLSDVHSGQKTLVEHLKLKIRKVWLNRHPLFPVHVLAGISKLPGKRGCKCTLGFLLWENAGEFEFELELVL